MKIYVGNLAPETTEDDLRQAFAAFGQVTSVNIVNEKFTGVSKGFGFVEMPGKAHSLAAIRGLNHQEFKGKPLRVNEAQPDRFTARGKGRGGWR
jgi:RNA recognition motif-containing protein